MKILDRIGLAAKRRSEALELENKKLKADIAFSDGERWMLAQILESKEDDINSLVLRLEDVLAKYNLAISTNQGFAAELKDSRSIIKDLVESLEYEKASSQKFLSGLIEGETEWPEIARAKEFLKRNRKTLN